MDEAGTAVGADRTWRADVGHAALVGFGSVAGGVLVCLAAGLFSGYGTLSSDGSGNNSTPALAQNLAMLAVPCAFACWALALLSLRLTRGVRYDGRLLSIVLWTVLSPTLWSVGAALWVGRSTHDGGAVVIGVMAAGVGTGAWCLTLTPVWVALLSRRYLRRHPATRPDGGPAVQGRAEDEEDSEVARRDGVDPHAT